MKKGRSKRLMAVLLCMAMMLTSNISTLAEGEPTEASATAVREETQAPVVGEQPGCAVTSNNQQLSVASTLAEEPGTVEEPVAAQEEVAPVAPVEQGTSAEQTTPAEQGTPEQQEPTEAPPASGEPVAPETPVAPEETEPTEEPTEETTNQIPVLEYEDEQIKATVTADTAGVIPEGVTLKVVPITAEDKETKEQYEEVGKKLQEKVAEEEKEIAGYLAYDITLIDADGNKVEPNGNVKVSMEYKKAELPKEVAEQELSNVEVTVHHLEEDAVGEVQKVVDMGAEKKATVDTLSTDEGEKIKKVEAETESFSVFTITWTYENHWGDQWDEKFTINVKYVDDSGKEINVKNLPKEVTFDKSNVINLEEHWKPVAGYNQVKIAVDRVSGKSITSLKRFEEKKRNFISSYTEYYIKYREKDATTYTNWLQANVNNNVQNDIKEGKIYFVYEKIDDSPFKIVDNIIDDGSLTATFKEQPAGEVTYTWYRRGSEKDEYTKVEKVNFKDGNSNISEDGSKLYPAYDEGARKWYKVKAKIKQADGTETEMESETYQVPYYSKLENGSFETPKVAGNASNNQWSNEDYVEQGGVWKSTGTGKTQNTPPKPVNLEIIQQGGNGGQVAYTWHGDWNNAAKDGNQFAEINCQAAGALYQEVLTIPGQTLNYQLSHRARGNNVKENDVEKDTMYLLIMPSSYAKDINTQQDLIKTLKYYKPEYSFDAAYDEVGTEEIYNQDGVYIIRITSSDRNWQTVTGIGKYKPTAGLTRFFFMSGHTSSGSDTVGNFVDDISFSQELPKPEDGKFNFTIEKKFEGLGNDKLDEIKNKIQFTISAKKNQNDLTDEEVKNLLGINDVVVKGSDMAPDESGNLSISFIDRPIGSSNDIYEITVTEENYTLQSYKVTPSHSTTVVQNGKSGNPGKDEGVQATVSNIKSKSEATITFTNVYEPTNYKNINFKKIWDDKNNDFKTRPISLDVTLHASITYQNNKGETVTESLEDVQFISEKDKATHTLTGEPWSTSWRVPVYYNLNENTKIKIDYTISEGDIKSDYEYQKGTLRSGDGTGYNYKNFDNVTTTGDGGQGTSSIKRATRMSALPNVQESNNSSVDIGEPAHNKYVEYDRNAGEYVLNLDVTGKKGTATGVDVLFVIDTSGSMSDRNSGLLTKVQNLLTKNNGVIDKIFKADGNVNQAAFVSFAGSSETKVSDWYSASEKGTLKSKINKLYADGGTNWTYAWKKASDSLKKQNTNNNDKVVIFLSDGKPTYTYKQYSIFGEKYWAESGSGSDTLPSYYDDVIKMINGSEYLRKAALYSVYLNKGTKDGMQKITSSATGSGEKTHAQLVDGINLDKALDDILNKVIPTYKNVTIRDTLSDYVEFSQVVNGRPIVTVRKGNEELNKDQYEVTVTDKTVKVELLNGAALEDGATYTVSFRIKPSESANSTEYPHTGDSGTGATSAGQKGFHSNKEASVSYEIDGDTTGRKEAEYPKPVVQLTTHKLTYEKVWIKPDSIQEPTENVILHVTYTDGTTNQITLESSKDYKTEEIVPVTKKIQNVKEDTIDGYTPSYVYSEKGTKVTVTNSYSKIISNKIRVEKKWEGNGPKSPVQVSLYQSSSKGETKKYGETITLEDNNWSHEWEKLPMYQGTGENLITYTYAVREENIPENYTSNIVYTQKDDTTVATITNVYDENCTDENYYIANVLQTIPLTIRKHWEDNENSQGVRPSNLGVKVNNMNFTLSCNGNNESTWSEKHTILKRVDKNYTASENLSEYDNYYTAGEPNVIVDDKGVFVSFENTIKTTFIVVQKVWNDGDATNRPQSVMFKLYYRTKGTQDTFQEYPGEYAITEENRYGDSPWTVAIRNLPVAYEYQVREVNMPEGYSSSVTEKDGKFVITNTLKWSVVKTNKPLNSNEDPKTLAGAEFELKKDNLLLAKGISRDNGVIEWKTEEGQTFENMTGEYQLIETKAPNGYVLHEQGWTLTFENGLLKFVKDNKDNTIVNAIYDVENGARVSVSNMEIYELPSTGGSGIYWYVIGGTLLMLAAVLLLYRKNRYKKVVK